jgi:hypothetical protein
MIERRLRSVLLGIGLLSASCVVPPVVYQDGLPAATPVPGFAAARIGYNRDFWHHDSTWERPGEYMYGGVRFGQDWSLFSFEEGLTVLYPGGVLPCLQGGVGMRAPAALTLRALWTPVSYSGGFSFDPMLWWQLSLLAGTERQACGPGITCGLRASKLGMGPCVLADYAFGDISLRLEGSLTSRAPWAEENVRGTVLAAGLSVEPTKAIPRQQHPARLSSHRGR